MLSRMTTPVVLVVFSCLLLSVSNVRHIFMIPFTIDTSPSLEPGIGFDLSTSYGYVRCAAYRLVDVERPGRTAVIRHHNGSFTMVAKVEMDSEYKEMMQRFSLDSSEHSR